MRRTFWTERRDAELRELWPGHSGLQIAVRLGCTLASMYYRAHKLGLPRKTRKLPADTEERVRRLHAEGLSDRAIGKCLGIDRRTINDIRHARLKLPVNEGARRRAQLRAVRTQAKTLGIRPGGGLRDYAYRKFAASRGWPEDLRPRHVQILELLASEARPMDRWEIARRIGWNVERSLRDPVHGQRHLLASKDPEGSYLAHLIKRGLVISLRRAKAVPGKSGCSNRNLYTLAPAAIDLILQRSNACATA